MKFFSSCWNAASNLLQNHAPALSSRVEAAITKFSMFTPTEIKNVYRALLRAHPNPSSSESQRIYAFLAKIKGSHVSRHLFSVRAEICAYLQNNSGTATFNALLHEIESQFHAVGNFIDRVQLPEGQNSARLFSRNINQNRTLSAARDGIGIGCISGTLFPMVTGPLIALNPAIGGSFALLLALSSAAPVVDAAVGTSSYYLRAVSKGFFDTLTRVVHGLERIRNVCEMLLIFSNTEGDELAAAILEAKQINPAKSAGSDELIQNLNKLIKKHKTGLDKIAKILKYLTALDPEDNTTLRYSGRQTYEDILFHVESMYQQFSLERKYLMQFSVNTQFETRKDGTQLLTFTDLNAFQKFQLLMQCRGIPDPFAIRFKKTHRPLRVVLAAETSEFLFGSAAAGRVYSASKSPRF